MRYVIISDCEKRSKGRVHWPRICVLLVAWFEQDEEGVGVRGITCDQKYFFLIDEGVEVWWTTAMIT